MIPRMRTPHQGIALQVRNLRKAYQDVVAVDGLDLEVHSGECFGLLGPNGAGKTTTVEICEGLNTPDSGEVLVLGRGWGHQDRELRQRLGISLQETQFSEKLTVDETVQLFRSFYDRGPSPAEVIAMVQLQENPQSRRQLWELIERFKADGRSILLTTHYMDEAERLCDRVAIVDHGRMIALGTPQALIARLEAEHVVEFALAEPSAIDETLLRAIDGVCAAERRNGTYRLQVSELHRAMPSLLAELRRQGAQLAELRTHSATLEDVFVSLTGRHLRDE